MVNMETPKCRKLRRVKGSSKKKKNVCDEIHEPKIEKDDAGTSTVTVVTPPRSSTFTVIERAQEEVRGVEWQYHRKYVETDIPIVWGSPQGSPVVNIEQTINESPVHRPKRRTLSNAPRKLNSEEYEPPDFLNDILALSEKIKADEKNNDQSQSNTTTEEKEVVASKSALDESYSNFFDEDMNECMIQCSQELEHTSSENIELAARRRVEVNNGSEDQENKKTVVKVETVRSSPRKKISNVTSSLNTTSGLFHLQNKVKETEVKSSRVGNKNYVHSTRKTNTYVFQGRVLGMRANTGTLNSKACRSSEMKTNNSLQMKNCSLDSKLRTDRQKLDRTKSSKSRNISLDNSFETVKESFLDDDIEFLSTIPDDLEMIPESNSKQLSDKRPSDLLKSKQQNCNTSSVLEDSTYFEEGVLQYLDTIESNVTPSQPLRCTPEEIEKKRQEAKLKLQKKKLSVKK